MTQMYVCIQSEPRLWTVGFYKPGGRWIPEGDYDTPEEAAARVRYLNGEHVTLDPSMLCLIKDLAQALQGHHLGLTTTEPFTRTYERDRVLLNQAEDFLSIAQGRPQPWRIPETF